MTTEQALATLASYIDPGATPESLRIYGNPPYMATRQQKEAWTALRVLVKS